MATNKLQRFSELKTLQNVFEFEKQNKGKWKQIFKNDHPIVVELACGKGEYALGLAQLYPHKNFIGIDIKGNRMWVGAKKAQEKSLPNVLFLRTLIDRIDEYFEQGEVSEIWITFPDPFLKKSKLKKRLTHPKFLRLYQKIASDKLLIHLKTDSPDLIRFTKNVMDIYGLEEKAFKDNVYAESNLPADLQIKTHYEQLNISKSNTIFYLAFELNEQLYKTEKDKDVLDYEHRGDVPSPKVCL